MGQIFAIERLFMRAPIWKSLYESLFMRVSIEILILEILILKSQLGPVEIRASGRDATCFWLLEWCKWH